MDIPQSHIEDALKLEAEGKIALYQIWLRSGAKLYLKANNNVTWQGNLYEGIGIALAGVASYSDTQVSRPQLSIVNPGGVFAPLIRDGEMNRATVFRIYVLKQHIDADMNVCMKQSWTVMRCTGLIKNKGIQFELRDQTDGNNFICPARMYTPPTFPQVSLQ